ncbi:MAG TPA: glycosyltransferase [Actinomycetota bacterium]|nr:glycosyltransferase [Actinomycetota bacterium]
MTHLHEVDLAPLAPERFEGVLGPDWEEFKAAIASGRQLFRGRTIWNVNSTAKGGGVAEMLRSLLAYAEGGGVDTRWVVISGNPEFFRVTKRIHNNLHGAEGDGGDLGAAERAVYEQALEPNATEMVELVEEGDVVLLHDPQTAGLSTPLKEAGAVVLWRCHVGLDTPNDKARAAWSFLKPFLETSDSFIFSREAFVWDDLPDEKIQIVPPSIDAFSPKNQDMAPAQVTAILAAAGVVRDGVGGEAPTFVRVDGSEDRVDTPADVVGGPVPADARLVVQVSRWDRLKDPLGVMAGFVEHVAPASDARLVLAGPAVEEVADDPEGAEVLQEVIDARERVSEEVRERVHLACLPMEDGEENAALVNALQRRADVIVQKSLAEGFGLTVAEGMWKARPVVASRIGGIQDQIEDGKSGLLLDDARDLKAYGAAVLRLLEDPETAESMGRAARERVRTDFLGARHLMQYLDIIEKLLR